MAKKKNEKPPKKQTQPDVVKEAESKKLRLVHWNVRSV
jgi:hypothetical protein